MTREMALAAYRNVLRSVRVAFQGDTRLLTAARVEARQKFDQSRNLSPESEEATKGIEHAEGVAQVLRENVVQGERTAAGEAAEPDRFRLRIHEHTERGDNESIKMGTGGKCVP